MMVHAVTRNLGRRTTATAWVDREMALPVPPLMFLQELPSSGLPIPDGWRAIPRSATTNVPDEGGVRSALLVPPALADRVTANTQVLAALGPYAAAATSNGGSEPVVLVSVHASPRTLTPTQNTENVLARAPCESAPWWSDVVLNELRALSDQAVIAAGDYNEARLGTPDRPEAGLTRVLSSGSQPSTPSSTTAPGTPGARRRDPPGRFDRATPATRSTGS